MFKMNKLLGVKMNFLSIKKEILTKISNKFCIYLNYPTIYKEIIDHKTHQYDYSIHEYNPLIWAYLEKRRMTKREIGIYLNLTKIF